MFETAFGLPAHPLLVHAPVVFLPLLALAAIVYSLVPALRGRLRWAVTLLALAGPLSAVGAKLTGDAFRRRLTARGVSGALLAKIDHHNSLGNMTMWTALAFGVVTLLLVVATMKRRSAATDISASTGGRVVQIVLVVATVALAGATAYYVIRTGDSGARMAWTGS